MTGGNDEFSEPKSWFALPHSPAERNAAILWIVTTIVAVVVAGILGFNLVGNFISFPPWVFLPLLVTIPIILYMMAQSKRDTPKFTRRTTSVVILWYLSTAIIWPTIGFDLSSIYLAITLFGLGFVGPLLYLRYSQGFSISELGFTRGTRRNVIVSIIITALYGVLVFVQFGYWEWLGFTSLVDLMPGSDPLVLVPIAFLFGGAFAMIAAALPEELVFRGVLQSYFAERNGRLMGLLIASLIFGLFHILVNTFLYQSFYGSAITPLVFMSALAHTFLLQAQGGLIFGLAWERTRSMLLPVMLHTIHNAVELLPFYVGVMLGIFI
ncbi:MAG: lysostaphin resistance A-like protein [Candidatus Thorarchaeota archaeon]